MTTTSAIVLIGIMGFVLVLTHFALTKRNVPLSVLAGISWILPLVYTRSNPLPNMPTGSYGDEIVLWVCILMIPLLLFNGYKKWNEDRKGKFRYYNDAGDYVGRYEVPPEPDGSHAETAQEYKMRLRSRIRTARENRRRRI